MGLPLSGGPCRSRWGGGGGGGGGGVVILYPTSLPHGAAKRLISGAPSTQSDAF